MNSFCKDYEKITKEVSWICKILSKFAAAKNIVTFHQ